MESSKPLFKGLDDVNWQEAECCSWHPEHLKIHLLRTLSEDPKVVEVALHKIFEMTWHQATRYQGTMVILPFLMELLEQPGFSGKVQLLGMLNAYATGFPEYFLPFGVDSYQAPGEDEYQESHLTYLKLGELVHRLLPLLHDPDPEVRLHAVSVLGWYGQRAEELVGPVLDHARTWVHPETGASCLDTTGNPVEQVTGLTVLGMLARHHLQERVERYLLSCLDSPQAPVRLGAAMGLVALECRNPRVIQSLFEVLSNFPTLLPEYRELPYWAGYNNTVEALLVFATEAMVQQPRLGSEWFKVFVGSPGAEMVQWCKVIRVHPGLNLAQRVLYHNFMYDVQDEENTVGKSLLYEVCSGYVEAYPDPWARK